MNSEPPNSHETPSPPGSPFLPPSFLDTVDENVAILDRDGSIVAANEAWKTFARQNRFIEDANPAGIKYSELLRRADREIPNQALEGLEEVLQNKRDEFRVEYSCAGTDQKQYQKLLVSRFECNEETLIKLTHDDVTEQKQRNRRFEAIFNNTNTFIGLLKPDGTLIEANQTALSFGGLHRDDVVGKSLEETYWFQANPETQEIVQHGIEKAQNGEPFREEVEILGKDREAIIDFSLQPVTNDRGQVILLVPEGRDITARKREQEKRQKIISRVTNAIVEVDADWKFTLVNEHAEELYDMDENDLLGKDFWDVFEEAAGTRFEKEYRNVMETREITSFVEYYSGLDGWFDITAYPKEGGGISFYFVEVTQNKQLQDRLQKQEERFRTMAETIDQAFFMLTPEYEWIYVNPAFEDLYGVSERELNEDPMAWQEYIPDSDLREEILTDVEAQQDGTMEDIQNQTFRVKLPGKPVRWLRVKVYPVRDNEGELFRLVGTATDITNEQKIQQKLTEQNKRLELSQQIAKMGHWSISVPDLTPNWSDETYRIYGREPSEPQPDLETIFRDYHLEDEEDLWEIIQRTIEHGETIDLESEIERPDGEQRHVHVYGIPRHDDNDDLIDLFGVFQDITQEKQLREELRDSLDQQTRLLQEVHHRVKNNLQVIIGLIRLQLRSYQHDDRMSEHLQNLQDRIHTMALIHNRVYQEESFTGIDAENYFQSLVDDLAQSLLDPDFDFRFRMNVEPVQLDIEILQPLALVLNELVTNAFKHGFQNRDQGSLELSLQTRTGPRYQLTLKDNGQGWSEDDPLDDPETLGLKLVMSLVEEQLDGSIETLESNQGVEYRINFRDRSE